MSLGSPARIFLVIVTAAACLSPHLAFADPSAAPPPPGATRLTLINGWNSAGKAFAKASISSYQGIVHLQGAIKTQGTNAEPFVIPVAFRPAAKVTVKVDMCSSTAGALVIDTDGTVTVQAQQDFSNAQCFTSLDGATYALSTDGFHALSLQNGWAPYGSGTAAPAARLIGNMVHFQGALADGSGSPFLLPGPMRPAAKVYAPVNMAGASNGRIDIAGKATSFESEISPDTAASFTSLDGAFYALDTTGFTPLTLTNGWVGAPFGTGAPGARAAHGIVELEGAMATTGSSNQPFVLPIGFRPSHEVVIPVDTCDATNGALDITPDGVAVVQADFGFAMVACFTSLEGASFRQ